MDEERIFVGGTLPQPVHHPSVQQFNRQQSGSGSYAHPLVGFSEGAQKLTPGGFQPLNREERKEAERIALESTFSYDGYQVARREFFSHKFDPTLTFKENSITFNNACIKSLDGIVYIQILVNPDEKKLVIRPCREGARDAIRWCVIKTDKRKSRQISCNIFAGKIYTLMNWEKLYYYKVQGTRIIYDGQEIYLFDLTSQEPYPPTVRKADGSTEPKKSRRAVYPFDWKDSFGLDIEAHDNSTRINLLHGFGLEEMSGSLEDSTEDKYSMNPAVGVGLI